MDAVNRPAIVPRWRGIAAWAVCGYLLIAGVAIGAWLAATGRASLAVAVIVPLLPLVLAAALVLRADPDDRQYVAKLFACLLFGPALVGGWAATEPSPSGAAAWPFALGGALLHVAAIVGGVAWLGTLATRVAPAAGAASVDASLLRGRLLALAALGVPATVSNPSPDELIVDYHFADAARTHRVTLLVDTPRRRVRVFERTGASGARPVDAAQASMRGPGERHWDPARPQAQRVSATAWQTTMIDPKRLGKVTPSFDGARVDLAHVRPDSLDPEDVVTLLCAVVTGSGWAWQPGWRR